MSSDEALANRAKRLSAWQSDRAALLGQADAFVVVSWWQEKSSDRRSGEAIQFRFATSGRRTHTC